MSETINPFEDYVFALSDDEFFKLKQAIDIREDKEKYGFTSFEKAAVFYKRKPVCPCCGSDEYINDGHTSSGHMRYRCRICDKSYTLFNFIFNSAFFDNKKNKSENKLMIEKIKKYRFLFEELVSRDFKQKYKRTILGMLWSVLSPLLHLAIVSLVMTRFFGKDIPHYNIYLFCGTLVMSYYKESTTGGMNSLMANRDIISKINLPKYMFLLSKNVSSLINFLLTLSVFFLFCFIDHIKFGTHFFMIIFVVVCLAIFNIGVGLILSALYVFFRDISYLYDVFLVLLNYVSAIFYKIDSFPVGLQRLFLCNPIYVYIHYFRVIVTDGNIPSLQYHLLSVFYAMISLLLGCLFYKKYNHKFLYYM